MKVQDLLRNVNNKSNTSHHHQTAQGPKDNSQVAMQMDSITGVSTEDYISN